MAQKVIIPLHFSITCDILISIIGHLKGDTYELFI